MPSTTTDHPNPDDLKAFGSGRLDTGTASTIQAHVETCIDCQKAVAETPGDSFLDLLRAAQQRDTAFAPHLPEGAADGVSVPRELADNPEYTGVVELGRGGMGVVYKAHNRLMDRDEVLKVMGLGLQVKPEGLDRFQQEIQAVAKLDHPNIVRAYTARQLGNLLVFSMEYVPGEDLGKLVQEGGPLPVADACAYAVQVADGLQHAHSAGAVHRDIKPANLMRVADPAKPAAAVKILDFGLAKVGSETAANAGLTGGGTMMGTPDYMAPEQIDNARSADIRADIYSLGVEFPTNRGQSLAVGLVMRPLELGRGDVPQR